MLAGLGLLALADGAWRDRDLARDRAASEHAAGAVALELSARLADAERAVSALAEAARATGDDPARVEAVARALLVQAPEAVAALALAGGRAPGAGGEPGTVSALRSAAFPRRLEADDVASVVSAVLATDASALVVLDDGDVLLALPALPPVVPEGRHGAVALALLRRDLMFEVASDVAYSVLGPAGEIAHRHAGRGGPGGAKELGSPNRTDRPADPIVRTIRPGRRAWTVEAARLPATSPLLRLAVVGGGSGLVLLVVLWSAWQAGRRREAQSAARLYRTLFEEASELVLVLDEDLRVQRANRAAERLFDVVEPRDYGGPFLEAFAPTERHVVREALERARGGGAATFTATLRALPTRIFRFRSVPLLLDDALEGIQVLAEDVTERHRLQEELADRKRELETLNERLFEAAITDPLTGVLNRRHLTARAAEEIERARRYGRDLTCLFLDLDHFKSINDTWGHAAGDEVLRTFADRLRKVVRRTDVVGRYGGEEFVVILTDTPEDRALPTARKILEMARETSYPGLPPEHRVTVSIGAAALGDCRADAVEHLFDAADGAAYRAKAEGRDRLVVFEAMAA